MPHHTCFECSTPFHSAYLPGGKPQAAPLCPKCSFEDDPGEFERGGLMLQSIFDQPLDHDPISEEVIALLFGEDDED